LFSGKGISYHENGNEEYEGEWEKNTKNGQDI